MVNLKVCYLNHAAYIALKVIRALRNLEIQPEFDDPDSGPVKNQPGEDSKEFEKVLREDDYDGVIPTMFVQYSPMLDDEETVVQITPKPWWRPPGLLPSPRLKEALRPRPMNVGLNGLNHPDLFPQIEDIDYWVSFILSRAARTLRVEMLEERKVYWLTRAARSRWRGTAAERRLKIQ